MNLLEGKNLTGIELAEWLQENLVGEYITVSKNVQICIARFRLIPGSSRPVFAFSYFRLV